MRASSGAPFAATTPANLIQSAYAAAAEAGDGKRYPYHYQVMFNTDQQAAVCVDYMVSTLGVKKVAILQENTRDTEVPGLRGGAQRTAVTLRAMHGIAGGDQGGGDGDVVALRVAAVEGAVEGRGQRRATILVCELHRGAVFEQQADQREVAAPGRVV